MRRNGLVALGCVSLLACSRSATVGAPPPANGAGGAVPAARPLSESEARALLDAWAQAQNRGDFAAYEALYAARLDGVRRTGAVTHRFDRAGWINDRRRMFQTAMQVVARDVAVAPRGEAALVRFTQEFTSGSFHDVGPKEMLLVREGAGVRIAREEMLTSQVSEASAGEPSIPEGAWLPLITVGDHSAIVLGDADAAQHAAGDPELLTPMNALGDTIMTRAQARTEALPESVRALAGATLRMITTGGGACRARLGAFEIVGRVDVHFSTEQRWAGEDVDGRRVRRATRADVAGDAWGASRRVIAARYTTEGACGEEIAARRESLAAPVVFSARAAEPAVAQRALARLRAMPAWREVQDEYQRQSDAQRGRNWDEVEGAGAQVREWRAEGAARRFVTLEASVGGGGLCGAFGAAMTLVFEVGGPEGLILYADERSPAWFTPSRAVDLDGDGVPEFVTERGLAVKTGTVFRETNPDEFPNLDCGC